MCVPCFHLARPIEHRASAIEKSDIGKSSARFDMTSVHPQPPNRPSFPPLRPNNQLTGPTNRPFPQPYSPKADHVPAELKCSFDTVSRSRFQRRGGGHSTSVHVHSLTYAATSSQTPTRLRDVRQQHDWCTGKSSAAALEMTWW